MKSIQLFIVVAMLMSVSLMSCTKSSLQKYNADAKFINYSGRIEKVSPEKVVLIGSASSVSIAFSGDSCVIYLQNKTPNGLYNFYSLELDGEDLGRTRIDGDSMKAIPVAIPLKKEKHRLTIYKSTEAANGCIVFGGVTCGNLLEIKDKPTKSIEFIGNSITCGMGNDTSYTPCHAGQWYDQHNAYWAYGPIVSRTINVNYMLSSVSGIGIYRNWDVEDGPTMPMVYENSYLNTDNSKRWDFTQFKPDIVSICLGTNDFSDGDKIHVRHPFNSEVFTSTYIRFIETIYSHYPTTQIALLASPMLSGEKGAMLLKCLTDVKTHFDKTEHLPIAIFQFEGIVPHGCDYHPNIDDHKQMADQLIPFYQNLLDEED